MSTPALPTLLFLLVPLVPVLAFPLIQYSRRALELAPWIPLSALLLVPFHGTIVEYPWLLLGARVGLDEFGLGLLLLAAVVWTLAGLHARRTIAPAGQPRFFTFWVAAWCGNLCVFITHDAASFYAAYAMMTFAAWGLVVHNGAPLDRQAGRIYLAMALLGEALILAGLFGVGAQLGNVALGPFSSELAELRHAGLIAGLFATGFGVKLAVIGLHMWLPLTYDRAPAAAAAVLAGVMLKAGLAGWLRFLPLGSGGFEALGSVLVVAGLVMGFYAAAVGICQTRAKVIIAYSSPSQMLFVTVPVGLALLYPEHARILLLLAVAFAVHHGLAKAALFLGLDMARDHPLLARALLWLPAASLAGLPLTSGAVAKLSLKAHLPPAALWLEPILLASSVMTTLLVVRLLLRVDASGAGRLGAPATPWLTLLVLGIFLPWTLFALHDPGAITRPLALPYLAETLGPIALGIAVAVFALRGPFRRALPVIPPGDILALLPRRLPDVPLPRLTRPRPAMPARWIMAVESRLDLLTLAVVAWLGLLALLFML